MQIMLGAEEADDGNDRSEFVRDQIGKGADIVETYMLTIARELAMRLTLFQWMN